VRRRGNNARRLSNSERLEILRRVRAGETFAHAAMAWWRVPGRRQGAVDESSDEESLSVTIKLALAGDTMLGRGVAERLASAPPQSLFAPEVVEAAQEADLFVLNLECCISDRGSPWPM